MSKNRWAQLYKFLAFALALVAAAGAAAEPYISESAVCPSDRWKIPDYLSSRLLTDAAYMGLPLAALAILHFLIFKMKVSDWITTTITILMSAIVILAVPGAQDPVCDRHGDEVGYGIFLFVYYFVRPWTLIVLVVTYAHWRPSKNLSVVPTSTRPPTDAT